MTAEPREDAGTAEAGDPAGDLAASADSDRAADASADSDRAALACPPGPGACLPKTDVVAGWPACASCGLPQAPGKEFCGFCGRRWVSVS
jgi:hypothetical protein